MFLVGIIIIVVVVTAKGILKTKRQGIDINWRRNERQDEQEKLHGSGLLVEVHYQVSFSLSNFVGLRLRMTMQRFLFFYAGKHKQAWPD